MATLSLIEALAEVPDPRSRHGRIHPLPAVLALVVLAMLRGCKGPTAVAQFGRDYGLPLAHALGFTRGKTPAASCLCDLLSRLDAVAFEAALARRLQARTAPADGAQEPQPQPLSVDGKTLRGSRDGEVPGQHLVAAYAPLVEAVLVQVRVDAKTNAHKAALQLLGILPVEGRIVTGDAIVCQRALCQQIIDRGGDYLFFVKDNQPGLQTDIRAGFALEAGARAIAAAFSPGRPSAPTAAGVHRHGDREEARPVGAAAAAGYGDPDAPRQVAGAEAGLRVDPPAPPQGEDDGGSGLRHL